MTVTAEEQIVWPTAGQVLPNGATVIASSARNADEWVILAMQTNGAFEPYVTWVASRPGDLRDTVAGHYFGRIIEAAKDFEER